MTARRLSPTANLLRTSRIFSLPPPLARPAPEINRSIDNPSDTATLPHPIHAAIQTSESSLGRGDWGLKRQLPLKSTTKTSTPMIYIENLDSIDHIIDFGSALDHIQTLEKWQEMDLSLSMSGQTDREALRSPFESKYDNTEIHPGTKEERWRFKGPWIAGKTNGEFTEYLKKNVKGHKLDFRQFLRERFERLLADHRRQTAIENGQDMDIAEESVSISEEEIDEHIRMLRRSLEQLYPLLEEFLDLPIERAAPRASRPRTAFSKRGPPTTHPSAGLSYTRTHSHVHNHPVYGPQTENAPVQARVLRPQSIDGRKQLKAILGVGGIVTADFKITFTLADELPAVREFDPDLQGGGKLWVHPRRASIGPRGNIELFTQRASRNAMLALMGEEKEKPPEAAAAAAEGSNTSDVASSRPVRPHGRQYYGLENLGDLPKSERAQPFEGEDVISMLGGALGDRSKR